MKISNDRKLKDLQTEFNQRYPFLQLAFFQSEQPFGQISADATRLDPELTIGQIQPITGISYIPLNSDQKVGDLELYFARAFGLHVQVYRKSYGKWLQTWATDIWTLEEQNNRGRIMGDKCA